MDHDRFQSLPTEPSMAEGHSRNPSNTSSASTSRPSSLDRDKQRQRGHHRVKFSLGGHEIAEEETEAPTKSLPHPLSRPATRIPRASNPLETEGSADVTEGPRLSMPEWNRRIDKERSAVSTQHRASKLASQMSTPPSKQNSVEEMNISPTASPPTYYNKSAKGVLPVGVDDIPLIELDRDGTRRPYSLYEDSTDEDSPHEKDSEEEDNGEASRLVRTWTDKLRIHRAKNEQTGHDTPAGAIYLPPPKEYKTGILSALLKLYDQQGAGNALKMALKGRERRGHDGRPQDHHEKPSGRPPRERQSFLSMLGSQSGTPGSSSARSSGTASPRRQRWYEKEGSRSTGSIANLLAGSSSTAAGPARPDLPRSRSSGMLSAAVDKIRHPKQPKQKFEDQIAITVHIAEVLSRQEYLIKLCRALMMYGAPTHRLEEYLKTSARALQIHGQFLYLPGCMIVSFDDPDTHTTDVKVVKENHGVDLGRFKDVFNIYKEVIHDNMGVKEAVADLDGIMKRKPRYPIWLCILTYGAASAFVGPFAFGARHIDLPICFLLGCVLGVLQLVLAPMSDHFSNVLEIAATVLTSFAARGFGSIYYPDGTPVFCFSALAQSSIALILPGYTILCGSLELQSRNIIAGSVRMVYAIIFALFLGFGITIGTALYGLIDRNATSMVTCPSPESMNWWTKNVYLSHFPFVPLFTICLTIINHAKLRQMPAMIVISFAGYQVNFWSARRFANNVQIANALGAFAVGCLANVYSRTLHGLAASAMLPAIFVQVPSGLAAAGSLVAGLTSADQITGNATGISVVNNGTQGFVDSKNVYSGTVFNVGYGMVQVAIGIGVGLFLSALVIYPFGKKRSGLFSF